MAYASTNFASKKALKAAVAAGERVTVFSPGPFPVRQDGEVAIEGPHFPKAHTWYSRVLVRGGQIVKVIA